MELSKVTMILRGYTYEQVKCVAEVLTVSKYVRNMEITLNTENAYDTIQRISDEYQDRLNIGAGTVQTIQELRKAVDAGAKFALSPRIMTEEMLFYCKEKGIIAVPGAFTASEIAGQLEKGADIVKVFPANEVSLRYAEKLCEPMGELPLMAVGGINRDNVNEAFRSGYKYVGTAGGLFNKKDILALDHKGLMESLDLFESELS